MFSKISRIALAAVTALGLAGAASAGGYSSGYYVYKPAPKIYTPAPVTYVYKPVIVYPSCPAGFTLTYKSAYKVVCAAQPYPYHLQNYIHWANKTHCGSSWWNLGSQVYLTGSNYAPVVSWVCKHG